MIHALVLMAVAAYAAPHPACLNMSSYQADYVAKEYDMKRHMGKYYELAFRDLYPGAPECDCQRTTKIQTDEDSYYEEFNFKCGAAGHYTPCLNTIVMNKTGAATYNQTITSTSVDSHHIPDINKAVFNTATVAFKASTPFSTGQYEWVIEFTCGTVEATLPFKALFPGGFVGLNFYSKSGPLSSRNLAEMTAAAKDLGLGWAMDSWGVGWHDVPQNTSCTW
jgi:hypothetical protein